jgi:hypothetical protein
MKRRLNCFLLTNSFRFVRSSLGHNANVASAHNATQPAMIGAVCSLSRKSPAETGPSVGQPLAQSGGGPPRRFNNAGRDHVFRVLKRLPVPASGECLRGGIARILEAMRRIVPFMGRQDRSSNWSWRALNSAIRPTICPSAITWLGFSEHSNQLGGRRWIEGLSANARPCSVHA